MVKVVANASRDVLLYVQVALTWLPVGSALAGTLATMRGTSLVSCVTPGTGVADVVASLDQRTSPSPGGWGIGVALAGTAGVAGNSVATGGVLVAGATIVGLPPQAVSRARLIPTAGRRARVRLASELLPGWFLLYPNASPAAPLIRSPGVNSTPIRLAFWCQTSGHGIMPFMRA
jgi:hypothetical protein